jgi:hypothetical protein
MTWFNTLTKIQNTGEIVLCSCGTKQLCATTFEIYGLHEQALISQMQLFAVMQKLGRNRQTSHFKINKEMDLGTDM